MDRLRTEWDLKALDHWLAQVIWDNEIIGGNYVGTEEFAARQAQRDLPFPDMNYEIVHRNDFVYDQNFHRAFVQFNSEPLNLTVGRQKIDWGVMRLIPPTDLFGQLPLFTVEREERTGVTAVNLTVPVGTFKINPVYTIEPDFDHSRTGLRVTKTVGHFDLSALGGRFLRDGLFGADFTGDLNGAGIRGELLYDDAAEGGNFIQFAAGADYGFENSLTLALEYFFNGQGTNNPLAAPPLFPFPKTGPPVQTVHKNFVALDAKYDLTPLWSSRLDLVADLSGVSFFINPETRYSLFEWMELAAGAQLNTGRGGGEFTALPHLYYLQGQVFF